MQAKKGDAVVWEALLRDNKNMLRMLIDKDLGEALAKNICKLDYVELFCCEANRTAFSKALVKLHEQQPQGLCDAVNLESWSRTEGWAVKQMLIYVRTKQYRCKDYSRHGVCMML